MNPLWKKMNLGDQRSIVVVNAPDSFETEIANLEAVSVSRRLANALKQSFFLVFVTRLAEVEGAAKAVARAEGDPIVWFAYPKGSSKRYKCELDRDTGWTSLGAAGFEPVRMVAIDEDWSALRFRRVEKIRTMTRDPRGALTKAGKARSAKKK